MSANTPFQPQVPASSTDVWQQFFREALSKRGPAAARPETRAERPASEPALVAEVAADGDADPPAEAAKEDGAPRPHLRLSALELWALALFGASVFASVSLLLYAPGDYFDSAVLESRSEVSFSVGKAIFRPFGLAVYSLLGFTLFWSGAVFFRQGVRGLLLKAFGVAVFTTALAGLFGLAFPGEDGAGALVHGGVAGEFLARRMTASFDTLGATALLVLVSLISLIFATDWFFTSLVRENGPAAAEDEDTTEEEEEDALGNEDVETASVIEAIERTTDDEEPVGMVPVPVAPTAEEKKAADAPRRGAGSDERAAAEILETAVRASSRRSSAGPDFVPVGPDPRDARGDAEPAPPGGTAAGERSRLRWRRRDEEPAIPEEAPVAVAEEPAKMDEEEEEERSERAGVRASAGPVAAAPGRAVAEEEVSESEPAPMPAVEEEEEAAAAAAVVEAEPEDTANGNELEPEAEREPEPEEAADDEFEPPDEHEPEPPVVARREYAGADPEEIDLEDDPEPEPERAALAGPGLDAAAEAGNEDGPAGGAPSPGEEPPSAPEPRKAQLSLFDEVIDEIARSGRESRGRVPRVRPASPIPPVTATPAPSAIDAETYGQAVRIVLESGRGSVSLLQRRLDVGYVTANRLLELMERDGIVGEHRGSGSREVRTTIEEWLTRPEPDPETD